MDAFAQVVLVIFVIIRILIAAGLIYLIVYEVQRYRKARPKKEVSKDGKKAGDNINNSSSGRS